MSTSPSGIATARHIASAMQWIDEGIVLGVRKHGEGSVILELLTRDHGRHLGLVRGGSGVRLKPVLQPGNSVRATWRARLDEHLGNYSVEGIALRAGRFLGSAHAVYGVTHLAALCRLLPERDPHLSAFLALDDMFERFDDRRVAAAAMVRFELAMLAELGFGLDLANCAATGTGDDLVYVSPKSGRAVSRAAGEPWRAQLLGLPAFLAHDGEAGEPSREDIAAGFALTGYFITRHILAPRGLEFTPARERFIATVAGSV